MQIITYFAFKKVMFEVSVFTSGSKSREKTILILSKVKDHSVY